MSGNLSEEDETFRKKQAARYPHYVDLESLVQIVWGQVNRQSRILVHYKPMRKY